MKKKHRKPVHKKRRTPRGQAKLPFGRAVKARRACGCNGRCCSAAGSVCECRCHGRHQGQKVVYRNPPAARIPVSVIGEVESITYRRGGKRWRHQVEGSAKLCAPKSGSYVVIEGIKVSHFLEG